MKVKRIARKKSVFSKKKILFYETIVRSACVLIVGMHAHIRFLLCDRNNDIFIVVIVIVAMMMIIVIIIIVQFVDLYFMKNSREESEKKYRSNFIADRECKVARARKEFVSESRNEETPVDLTLRIFSYIFLDISI